MAARPLELIRMLRLAPHPEGGWYREIHRARCRVVTARGGAPRSAVTQIYYLLNAGERSRWHRIDADELWHFYEGDALTLLTLAPRSQSVTTTQLGKTGRGRQPVAVVEAGTWQAATIARGYALVGCTVAPGFVFDRFELLADDKRSRQRLEPVLGRWKSLI